MEVQSVFLVSDKFLESQNITHAILLACQLVETHKHPRQHIFRDRARSVVVHGVNSGQPQAARLGQLSLRDAVTPHNLTEKEMHLVFDLLFTRTLARWFLPNFLKCATVGRNLHTSYRKEGRRVSSPISLSRKSTYEVSERDGPQKVASPPASAQ